MVRVLPVPGPPAITAIRLFKALETASRCRSGGVGVLGHEQLVEDRLEIAATGREPAVGARRAATGRLRRALRNASSARGTGGCRPRRAAGSPRPACHQGRAHGRARREETRPAPGIGPGQASPSDRPAHRRRRWIRRQTRSPRRRGRSAGPVLPGRRRAAPRARRRRRFGLSRRRRGRRRRRARRRRRRARASQRRRQGADSSVFTSGPRRRRAGR